MNKNQANIFAVLVFILLAMVVIIRCLQPTKVVENNIEDIEYTTQHVEPTVAEIKPTVKPTTTPKPDTFTTNYTIIVKGDEEALFGYDGILVGGRLQEEALNDPDRADIAYRIGNFNLRGREYEVPVEVTIKRGLDTLFTQECGLRVHGGASRKYWQKSVKLYARKDYGNNTFKYPLFSDVISLSTGKPINDYKHLIVRNSGNDNLYAFIRSELCQDLALQSGFREAVTSRPATLIINDKYMGTYWLENEIDKRYFREMYGESDGEWIIYEGGAVTGVNADTDDPEYHYPEPSDIIARFQVGGVVNDDAYAELCDLIDVNNYIKYVAIQIYTQNVDWSNRNYKMYRYYNKDGIYGDGVFDGRYRWILYDMDMTLDLITGDRQEEWVASFEEDLFSGRDVLFTMLMDREDFRHSLAEELRRLETGVFAPEYSVAYLHTKNDSHYSDIVYMLTETDIIQGPNHNKFVEPSIETVLKELDKVEDFLNRRPSEIEDFIYTYLQ